MVDPEEIILEARSWIGTPYNHMECKKGIACDCIGLIKGVGFELGYLEDNIGYPHNYSRFANGFSLRRACNEYLQPLSASAQMVGSIVLFWTMDPELPQHLGIISDLGTRHGLIHAYSPAKQVIEHTYDEVWLKKSVAYFTYKD